MGKTQKDGLILVEIGIDNGVHFTIPYILRQWDRLVGYLADGRLSPDNNGARERYQPLCRRVEELALFRDSGGSSSQRRPLLTDRDRQGLCSGALQLFALYI